MLPCGQTHSTKPGHAGSRSRRLPNMSLSTVCSCRDLHPGRALLRLLSHAASRQPPHERLSAQRARQAGPRSALMPALLPGSASEAVEGGHKQVAARVAVGLVRRLALRLPLGQEVCGRRAVPSAPRATCAASYTKTLEASRCFLRTGPAVGPRRGALAEAAQHASRIAGS